MVFEFLVGLPLLALAGYGGFKLNDKIKAEVVKDDPLNDFFTIGYFQGKGANFRTTDKGRKEVPGTEFAYQVVLFANGHDKRKYEIRCSHGNVDHIAKSRQWFILYVQPWLEGTIDTKKLIEIGTDSGFKAATVNYNRIKE